MGIFDWGTGNAKSDINSGYNQAGQYMNPYYQGGTNDWNQWNPWNQNRAGQFQGNPMAWQWGQIGQDPSSFYNKEMAGYSMSPQAQFAMKNMQNSMNNNASATGMAGSGAFDKALQQNANGISSQDMQQYWNNIMGANNMQMGWENNYDNQQREWDQDMQNGARMGYGAGGMMGQWDIDKGNADAYEDQQDMNNWEQLFGMGAQGMENSQWFKNAMKAGGTAAMTGGA